MRCDTPLPLHAPLHILDDPSPFLQLHMYLYSLKYKHSKKNIFFTKQNKKTNSAMSIMLCTGANFAKKNSCFVGRIVPCYTTGLHLLTFNILETYPSKDIALGISHVISH